GRSFSRPATAPASLRNSGRVSTSGLGSSRRHSIALVFSIKISAWATVNLPASGPAKRSPRTTSVPEPPRPIIILIRHPPATSVPLPQECLGIRRRGKRLPFQFHDTSGEHDLGGNAPD